MAAATAMSHLSNAAVNLVSLREYARKELVKLLESVKGSKALVLDPSLSGPLGLVAEVKLLKENGVDKIYELTSEHMFSECKSFLFLVRPRPHLMQYVAKQIHTDAKKGFKKDYTIFFVPRRTMLCERVLSEEGVYGDVKTGEYHLDLIPFEEDVLSLEMPLSFRECFLDGDPTSLFYVARSLMKIQSMFGIIPIIQGKGDNALQVYNLIKRMRAEAPKEHFNNIVPEIQSLILIDRNVDMVSAVLLQLTYEGLIDEVIGIRNGMVKIEAELLAPPKSATDKPEVKAPATAAGAAAPKKDELKPVPLNNMDPLYGEIRDLNFRVLPGVFHRKAEEIKEIYKEKDSLTTVKDMAVYMKKFKSSHQEHLSLSTHIAIADKIKNLTMTPKFAKRCEIEQMMVAGKEEAVCEAYLDAAIAKGEPFVKVLRLLCLYSLTFGIKPKKFDFLRREIVHTYGYERMFTLNNLEKMGLFRRVPAKSPWPIVRKALRLHKDDVDPKAFDEKAFVFDGYMPLSARLVELASERGGWQRHAEALQLLPGQLFELRQELPASVEERSRLAQKDDIPKKAITLVYFLGGVTFSEVSAIRRLSERENRQRDYIVASTQLMNGDSIINDVVERIENNLKRSSVRE